MYCAARAAADCQPGTQHHLHVSEHGNGCAVRGAIRAGLPACDQQLLCYALGTVPINCTCTPAVATALSALKRKTHRCSLTYSAPCQQTCPRSNRSCCRWSATLLRSTRCPWTPTLKFRNTCWHYTQLPLLTLLMRPPPGCSSSRQMLLRAATPTHRASHAIATPVAGTSHSTWCWKVPGILRAACMGRS